MNKGSVGLVIAGVVTVAGLIWINSYMYKSDVVVEIPRDMSPDVPASTTPATKTPSQPTRPTTKPIPGNNGDAVACTMEAKMCPDGSYVGRQGPQCEFSPCPAAPSAENQGDISLSVGQVGIFSTLNIKINSLIQDSRCPIGVACIQAGSVSANVTLSDGIRTETVTLESNQSARVFGNYRINLSHASPDAQSSRQLAPGDYTFVFHIVRS